jgi:FK506-binding nuclear protein
MPGLPTSFFGLTIEPNTSYSQTVEQDFKLTHACLASELPTEAARTCVVLKIEDKTFTLCALTPGMTENQSLDISLMEGQEIEFSVTGNCAVDLTGNHVFYDLGDDEEEFDEEIDSDLEADSADEQEIEVMMNGGI